MSQQISGREGHHIFPIGQKNKNLVEDVEILLPVKFRWIPFSGFREVENVKIYERRTNAGRRTTRDHISALEPSAEVHLKCKYLLDDVHKNMMILNALNTNKTYHILQSIFTVVYIV